jgi:signal transduction histidine kinase
MSLTAAGLPVSAVAGADRAAPLPAAEPASLRFIAGARAVLALLAVAMTLAIPHSLGAVVHLVLLPYLAWALVLLGQALGRRARPRWRLWMWVDGLVLLATSQLLSHSEPVLDLVLALPVVAMAVLAGVAQARALALVCTVVLLAAAWQRSTGVFPPLLLMLSVVLLGLAPAAGLLVSGPRRRLQQRLRLMAEFHARLDARRGLSHHVEVLLELLAGELNFTVGTLSLQGLEPRVFQWRPHEGARVLDEPQARLWRDRLAHLPQDKGCIGSSVPGGGPARVVAWQPQSRACEPVGGAARGTLLAVGAQTLTLPLLSFGQPLGHICLARAEPAFDADDLRWLRDVMRDALPLLERSDLLEQLQRETAARERERMGRDLHDSAVQPYLGLKYGLEALARQAGTDNPLGPKIGQLVGMANEELHHLRDVVSGLRSGHDPAQGDTPMDALQRQAARFEALYGLKVQVQVAHALELRASVARAVLHMVNEALTNVRRHTSATEVAIRLDAQEAQVVLSVRNNRCDAGRPAEDFVPLSLAQRAAELGGCLAATHQTDATEVTITLPRVADLC